MTAPLRFGLIGVGRWGKVYIKTLLTMPDRCRLTHLATSKPEHAALVPHPVTVLSDWRALLRSDCDAVIIATPPQTHAEILEACIEAGKPCIVEKPLCLDMATAERLHAKVNASGVAVLVNHTQLFDSAYRTLKHAVEKAEEPIRLILSEGMGLGPFRTDAPPLWDWGSHDISLCLDLLGALPVRVEMLGGPRSPGGIPELVSVRLEFPGETCAWIHAGCLSPQKRRGLSVFTDSRLYVWDAQGPERLTLYAITFSRRYAGGIPEPLQPAPMSVPSNLEPMTLMVTIADLRAALGK